MRTTILSVTLLLIVVSLNALQAETKKLQLSLQTRDANTNQVIIRNENVDVSKVGIVIVDPWDYHWCMTACERVSAMVPRWNKALEVSHKMGMPVVWVPSDVLGS